MRYGPDNPEITYVEHAYSEHLFDTGEARLNYATTGSADRAALLLGSAQTESWWGYEAVTKTGLAEVRPSLKGAI